MTRIIISMILSLFGIYGLQKAGIDFSKIAYDFGIERFIMEYFPLILIIISVIAMIKWGVGIIFILYGGILILLGLAGSMNEDIVYNWELIILMGVVLLIVGFVIKRKTYKNIGKIRFGSRNIFKSKKRIERRIRKLQRLLTKAQKKGDFKKADLISKQIEFLRKQLLEMSRMPSQIQNGNQPMPPQIQNGNNNSESRIRLARLYGIKNLEKKYQELYKKLQEGHNEAAKLHSSATKKGWNKTKEGTETYKKWYRQYTQNINTEKELEQINKKIKHLKSKI